MTLQCSGPSVVIARLRAFATDNTRPTTIVVREFPSRASEQFVIVQVENGTEKPTRQAARCVELSTGEIEHKANTLEEAIQFAAQELHYVLSGQ